MAPKGFLAKLERRGFEVSQIRHTHPLLNAPASSDLVNTLQKIHRLCHDEYSLVFRHDGWSLSFDITTLPGRKTPTTASNNQAIGLKWNLIWIQSKEARCKNNYHSSRIIQGTRNSSERHSKGIKTMNCPQRYSTFTSII